jgi:hypothetical protein
MTRTKTLLSTLALIALPSLAVADGLDLPRLTFPDDAAPTASQGCAQPATLGPICRTAH